MGNVAEQRSKHVHLYYVKRSPPTHYRKFYWCGRLPGPNVLAMRQPHRSTSHSRPAPPKTGGVGEAIVLPALATAQELAAFLQVSKRTIHVWAANETIPTALRCGKVVRFHPPAVAVALGLRLPGLSHTGEMEVSSNTNLRNSRPKAAEDHES